MSYQITKAKFLNDDEFQALDRQLNHFVHSEPRNATALFALVNTGARPSELLLTKVKDLASEGQTIFLRGLKNSRDREIPLPPWLFKLIEVEAKGKAPDDPIFDITLRTLQRVWESYRPVKKGVRCLRHTFAIRLYKKTKDIRLVQLALGHKSINNTMVYADFIYNQEQFRKLLL